MQQNSFTSFYPSAGLTIGTVTVTGGVPALGSLNGGQIARDLITIVDNGSGDFTISVKNFKGSRGLALGFGAGKTIDTCVNPQTGTYSGDTLSMQFLIAAAGSASDTTFNFEIWAF